MIQQGTLLKIADNTGAKTARCIKVLGGTRRRSAFLGDIIVVAVKSSIPQATVKKKSVVRAVIVRQKNNHRRKDHTYIRFDDNAIVIINKENNEPKGSRIFGPVARELQEAGFRKIVSLAKEVV